MKDSRTVLDNVRYKLRGDEKMLVVYIGDHGELRCAQSNCTQTDLSTIVDNLRMNILSEKVGKSG